MEDDYIPDQLTQDEIHAMMMVMADRDGLDAFMSVYNSYRKTP